MNIPPENSLATTESQRPSWWQVMLKTFPMGQFILGALIPTILFLIFHKLGHPLQGAVIGSVWGLGVVLVNYWRSRRIDPLAAFGTALTVVQLIGTLITHNPALYLASSAIHSAIFGFLFLGSLLFPRSLIQVFVETSTTKKFSEFRQSRPYRTVWRIITAVWGGVLLLRAILLVIFQIRLPLSAFLAFQNITDFPLTFALFAFSFWFARQYFNRLRARGEYSG